MKVKVFQPNHHGKIEFTRAELENLLNEVYSDGYREGEFNVRSWTWTSPCLSTTPYYSTISTYNTEAGESIDDLTCASANANNAAKSIVDNNATTCASAPFTYTIELSEDVRSDSEAFSKAVDKIISNAHKSIWNQATRKDNDPIANLGKELNF